MTNTWIGEKRIAFIPVWNNQVDTRPPENWINLIRERVFYNPDPSTGVDGSLQSYVQACSSGVASIGGNIFPAVEASDADVVNAGLMSLPANHGFDYAVIVIPHSSGPHRRGYAWMGAQHASGVSNYARVPMFTDQAMSNSKTLGVWAMEVLHIVTRFGDLYFTDPMIGRFDSMACGCGTHLSAHTKSHFGWLTDSSIRNHPLGKNREYSLHAVSLNQPAPFWRSTAIRVKSRESAGHFIIEARLRNDQFETPSPFSSGIPSEGVIVYEVQGLTEIYLHTASALNSGNELEIRKEKLKIRVQAVEPGGFLVTVESGRESQCVALGKQIESLELSLQIEPDFQTRKQLISALQKAKLEFRQRGCLLAPDPGSMAIAELYFSSGAGAPLISPDNQGAALNGIKK